MKLNRSKKGFTLVEIMIVVVIIGLLAAMAIPAFQKVRRNSIAKTMLNDARQIASGMQQIYTQFPTLPTNGFVITYNTGTGLVESAANTTIGLNDNAVQEYVKTLSRGYNVATINYNASNGTNMAFVLSHNQIAPSDVLPTSTTTTLGANVNFDSEGKVLP
ncbi:MAG: prepilin-type N-terminal cleavage/methylation domain-containing protein [Nibricoccus sp.]